MENNIIDQIRNALTIFNKKEKIQFFLLFILMLVTGFIEAVGIGLIFPFIAVVTKPELIDSNEALSSLFNMLGFQSKLHFIGFVGVGLFTVFILKNLFFFYSQFLQVNYIIHKRVELTGKMFQGYMKSKYELHLNTNPAILLRNLNAVDGFFQSFLQPLFGIISEMFILSGICLMLLFNSWQILLTSLVFLGIPVLIGNKLAARRLGRLGKINFDVIAITSKVILEGLHGIKEVMVMNKQGFFAKQYILYSKKLGYVRRDLQLIKIIPKIYTEIALVGVVICSVMVILYPGKNFYDFLPTLGLFAVAAKRMVASLNAVVIGIQNLRFNQVLNNTVISELGTFKSDAIDDDLPESENLLGNKKLGRFSKVVLKDVTFFYKSSRTPVLNKLSLEIINGQSVGIVGASGAGKSTLMDILLGLLKPVEGDFFIDNFEYRKKIAEWASLIGYIPQSIYLRDDTLKSNIAFGLDKENIDEKALKKAIKVSQLEEVVSDLPLGLDTEIGERGVRLSGGQRQRIAIARALYHDPQILLMDEATSALDNQTEAEFMKSIESLRGVKTLVIIAHRLSTVKNCDIIYFLKDGTLESKGTFEELLKNNKDFKEMVKTDSV